MEILQIRSHRLLELCAQRVDLGCFERKTKVADSQFFDGDFRIEVRRRDLWQIRLERRMSESLSVLCSEHDLFPS